MITVLSWFWRQPEARSQYEPIHVMIWADMVRRHLSLPHRIACVTDEEIDLPGIEIIRPPDAFRDIRLPTWPEHRPQCLRRLVMFRPDAEQWFGPRFACMDLDCVISGSLDPILGAKDEFRIAKGTATGRPYNGSLMLLTAGARPQVYTEFSEEGAQEAGRRFTGSDQAWIAHCLGPNEAIWGEGEGVYFRGRSERVTFYPGAEKPWHKGRDPWVREHYRRESQGRCMILGYHRTVWRDAERALESGPFDGVIASPEAAEHWPGPILAVARDNLDADRLAAMHGFEDVTWCGRGA